MVYIYNGKNHDVIEFCDLHHPTTTSPKTLVTYRHRKITCTLTPSSDDVLRLERAEAGRMFLGMLDATNTER